MSLFSATNHMDAPIGEAIEILRCPISAEPLQELADDQLVELNERIRHSEAFHASRCVVKQEISAGLITADRQFVYPIHEGIVILLAPLAIRMAPTSATTEETTIKWSESKQVVQSFYDDVGWRKDSEGSFHDTARFVDHRSVVAEYDSKCHRRVGRYLVHGGKYLLDVASGPIPHSEYLDYGERFQYRVCADLSIRALKEARAKLGARGIYLLADVTSLPLADDSVDAVVSLHTIYHVPADEQFQAINELHRVSRPGSSAVVVYSWGPHSRLMKPIAWLDRAWWLARAPLRHGRRLWHRTLGRHSRPRRNASTGDGQTLYYHPHDYRTMVGHDWGFGLEVVVWRSVNNVFTRKFAHRWLFGRRILKFVFWLEERFPQAMGRHGQYPLFLVKKARPRIEMTSKG